MADPNTCVLFARVLRLYIHQFYFFLYTFYDF